MTATDWYSVAIEARSPSGTGSVAERALERFVTLLEPYSGVAGAGGHPVRWDARISVQAPGAFDAIRAAEQMILGLAATARMPAWPVVSVEAIREDVLDEQLARSTMPDLVHGPEAAAILGVSTQRVHQLAAMHRRFPAPAYKFHGATLWHRAAIEKFDREWERKTGRPRKAS